MNKEIKALALRLRACPAFRWTPGMATATGLRILKDNGLSFSVAATSPVGAKDLSNSKTWIPDLSDPATLGALLALVREGFGPTFHLIPLGGWLAQGARLPNGATVNLGICEPSEAAALVAALEAASLSPAP